MYKACVFDMDGTILNTLNSIAHFGNEALKKYGFQAIEAEKYKQMVGNGVDILLQRMLKEANVSDPEKMVKDIRMEYDRLYEANPIYLVEPYEGIKEMLAELKEKGIRLAVLSNKPDNMTKYLADAFFPNIFDAVYGQRIDVPKKPNPTVLNGIRNEFAADKGELFYCGDSGVDMQTGKNGRAFTVGVSWGFRSKKELRECGADKIVDTASELLELILGC